MNQHNIIEVTDLVKKYADFTAVNKISFQVKKGEIFGLLGPNGAGKSTTIEIMETLKNKTSGQVIINGLNIETNALDIKKIIGIQLQAASFYPNLNLQELLQMFAGLYQVEIDVFEMLSMVDLLDKKKSKFKELSGGQKQRFSIATTLINKPIIIFLDEPTTGLDPTARRNLWALLKKINNAGNTIIITTHYMDEADYLCDRIAIIDCGKIITVDTPTNLKNNLVASGFKKETTLIQANLEDVFINLTNKSLA
ncbi:MAG: ABC transporter ATP-binding protein [Sediminibacterium sp.]|nr:ABC transporter ATP-binding protein [Sediminibacterium sp.]